MGLLSSSLFEEYDLIVLDCFDFSLVLLTFFVALNIRSRKKKDQESRTA